MQQKLFRFEVDQSIRVEELTDSTKIAIANTENWYTVEISSRVKRRLLEHYRRMGKPKKFAPHVFTAGIILAIINSEFCVKELVIDIEYPGYETEIISLLNRYVPGMIIYFSIIGKKSPAHFAAYGVHVGRIVSDQNINFDSIFSIINKK